MGTVARRAIAPKSPPKEASDVEAYKAAIAARDAIDVARRKNEAVLTALRRQIGERLGYQIVMTDEQIGKVI